MAGRTRVLGLSRAFVPGAVACIALSSAACTVGSDGFVDNGGSGGDGGSVPFGSAGAATMFPEVPGGSIAGAPCVQDPVGDPVFAKQMLTVDSVARRELFSWTTEAQAQALRDDHVLFTDTEGAGLGKGFALTYLQQLSELASDPELKALSVTLTDVFSKPRYAWPEPWATRMGWPGEQYGDKLLRIVLKPEAWVAVVRGGMLTVTDLSGNVVPLADAIATPARLGAIFYQRDAAAGGPECGSFVSGGNGYREFILGNLAMVEEWSLDTQLIRDRLQANIDQLTLFLERSRACPTNATAQSWNLLVCCSWNGGAFSPVSEEFAYEQSLAIPSASYLALPERIAELIETLQADLFQPDPLVVVPGSP